MDLLQRLIGSKDPEKETDEDETDEDETDEVGYWCAGCGMLIKRSCSEVDYSWCVRCGATSVRERPWDGTSDRVPSGSMEAPVARDTGSRTEESDERRQM